MERIVVVVESVTTIDDENLKSHFFFWGRGGVLFGQPLGGRTECVYEEDEDVGEVIGGSLRPFLFLPRTICSRSPKGFVLNHMFLRQNLGCRAVPSLLSRQEW